MGEVDDYVLPDTAPAEPGTPDNTFERGLPASIDAERSILGAVLLDNQAFNEAAEALVADDFALDSHRKIFACMSDLIDDGHAADIVTLAEEFAKRKQTESIGGVAYLASLTEGLPRRISISEYVLIVKDKSLLRQAINICSNCITRAADQGETAVAIVEDVEAQLLEVAHVIKTGRLSTIAESIEDAGGIQPYMDNFTSPLQQQGLKTHYVDFDAKTGGLQRGELVIIAARPSMGKSAWAINIAVNSTCQDDTVVAVFSLEMTKEALHRRMIAEMARVDVRRATSGDAYLSSEEKGKMLRAIDDLVDKKIFIDDTPGISPMQMRAKARRLKQQQGKLDLIVVDYLQLMTPGKKTGNREQEVAHISRSLKAMAKELQCPVAALAQLSRASEQRQDKRPSLSDLRESGQIEQDADVVAFIHRDEYYQRDNDDVKGLADIIIAKQRNGPTGIVKLAYISEFTRFENLQRGF